MRINKMLFRGIVNVSSYRTNYLQKFLSTIQIDPAEQTKPPKKPRREYRVSQEICDQMKGTHVEYFLDKIPKKLLRRCSNLPRTLYLVNPATAKTLASQISQDLLKEQSVIIECNPGLGLLTEELLKKGIPFLHLFEKRDLFIKDHSPLGSLLVNHKNQIHYRQLNFFDYWMLSLLDNFNSENCADPYIMDFPQNDWESKIIAQIIALCPTRSFLSLMIHNFFRQTKLFQLGRPVFYIAIPSNTWKRATRLHDSDKALLRFYSHYNVFLYLFFDCKELGELPRRSFIPWPKVKSKSQIDDADIPMSVIRIEPKKNAYHIVNREDLKPFWFFLKYALRVNSNRVIKEFEKLVPGCGPKLIMKNMDICTSFKELPPETLLDLFKEFKTWPEYDETLINPGLLTGEETKREDDKDIDQEEDDKDIDHEEEDTLEDEREKIKADPSYESHRQEAER